MKTTCSQCIAGTISSGKICGRCNGTGEIDKVKKANLELDLAKYITFEEGHGFVLTDMNDSVYFTTEEALKICNFISKHHESNESLVVVKTLT